MGSTSSTPHEESAQTSKHASPNGSRDGYDSVSIPSFSAAFVQTHSPDEKSELTSSDLGTLLSCSNSCMLDTNVARRKQALQQILSVLSLRSLGNLQDRKDIMDALALALSLNVISTDDETQFAALKAEVLLSSSPVFVNTLLEKGLAESISSLLHRETTNALSLRLAVKIAKQLSLSSPSESNQLMKPLFDSFDELLNAGTQLGGLAVREVLLALTAFPLVQLISSDKLWRNLLDNLLSPSSNPDARLTGFLARLATEKGSSYVIEVSSHAPLIDLLLQFPSNANNRFLILAAKLTKGENQRLVQISSSIINACLTNSASESIRNEALINLQELSMLHPAFVRAYLSAKILKHLRVLMKQDPSLKTLVASTALIVIVTGVAIASNVVANTERQSLIEETRQIVDNFPEGDYKELGSILLVTLTKDVPHMLLQDHELVERAILGKASDDADFAKRLAAVYLLLKSLRKYGWIASGLFSEISTNTLTIKAFEREETEDSLERQFLWSWKQKVVDKLIFLANCDPPAVTPRYVARIAGMCLVELTMVDGADRKDSLQISVNWELASNCVPVNQARVDSFFMTSETVPLMLSMPRELKGGIFTSANDKLEIVRIPREILLESDPFQLESSMSVTKERPNFSSKAEWTVTVWLKQIKPLAVLESSEDSSARTRARCVVGGLCRMEDNQDSRVVINSQSIVVGFNEDMQLGCCSGSGEWTTFGAWKDLASGWHHVVILCGENKTVAGLDLVLGRTQLLTCYVGGHRFGAPVTRHISQCPSVSSGLVLSSDAMPLGEEFAISEVRLFETCLTDRVVSFSVARSSFNRRPNWNMSSSSGATRMTPAHVWARNQLLESLDCLITIRSLIRQTDDEICSMIGWRLIEMLSTVMPRARVLQKVDPNLLNNGEESNTSLSRRCNFFSEPKMIEWRHSVSIRKELPLSNAHVDTVAMM